jgi:hypothetical protein
MALKSSRVTVEVISRSLIRVFIADRSRAALQQQGLAQDVYDSEQKQPSSMSAPARPANLLRLADARNPAALYSGTIMARLKNHFFATDENLIELRGGRRPTERNEKAVRQKSRTS